MSGNLLSGVTRADNGVVRLDAFAAVDGSRGARGSSATLLHHLRHPIPGQPRQHGGGRSSVGVAPLSNKISGFIAYIIILAGK